MVRHENCRLGANMDIKRKAARGIAVIAIALAAGHLVQNMGEKKRPPAVASAGLVQKPLNIETVAAGPEAAKPTPTAPEKQPAPLPEAPLTKAPLAAVTPAAEPELPVPAAAPAPAAVEMAAPAQPTCDITLDLMAEPSAMIGITLIAPCHPNQRAVLRQGDLVVTGQTTATGALFTAIPAFETQATVEISFADGATKQAEIAVPDLAALRRFGVQWQADDAFQVHAFEDGADYGGAGHVSAADPHRPVAGLPAVGGFLTLAGDSTTDNPLLAEIYTFPADPAAKSEVVVEAAVTEKTCGRELLAETLTSIGGEAYVTDLTLAMPECDAIGDYLVLKNLVLDLNIASVN